MSRWERPPVLVVGGRSTSRRWCWSRCGRVADLPVGWFLVVAAVAALAGAAVAAVSRLRSWSVALTVAVAVGAILLLGWVVPPGFAAPPSQVPTTLADALLGTVTGWKDLITVDLPVGTYRNLLVPAIVVFLGGTLLGLRFAWSSRQVSQWPLRLWGDGVVRSRIRAHSHERSPRTWGPGFPRRWRRWSAPPRSSCRSCGSRGAPISSVVRRSAGRRSPPGCVSRAVGRLRTSGASPWRAECSPSPPWWPRLGPLAARGRRATCCGRAQARSSSSLARRVRCPSTARISRTNDRRCAVPHRGPRRGAGPHPDRHAHVVRRRALRALDVASSTADARFTRVPSRLAADGRSPSTSGSRSRQLDGIGCRRSVSSRR